MEDLNRVWAEIADEQRTEPGWHVRRICPDAKGLIQLGLRQPGSIKALLYEVGASSLPASVEMPEGTGFRTDVESVIAGPDGRVRLILALSNSQYEEIFTALCSDVLTLVGQQVDELTGVQTFVQRLSAWQKFMRAFGRQGLSPESVQGLFAEISFLHDFVLPELSPGPAVAAWKGPNALQDFVFGDFPVEVKSSLTATDPVVRISSLEQLDESEVPQLFLLFVGLRSVEVGGENLPSLIEKVRSVLASEAGALRRFEDLILEAGYHDSHRDHYSVPLLAVDHYRSFEACGDFPRIKASELNPGIVSGRYSIRLTDCEPYEIGMETLRAIVLGTTYGS